MPNPNQQHTFANPAPGALIGLVMACFCLFAINTGKVSSAAAPILACWLIGGGLLQYMTGLMELRNGDQKGGNTFFLFGAFLMFANAFSLLTKYILTQKSLPVDVAIEGWAWLAVTICVILWTPAFLRKNTAILFSMMCTLDVALVFVSFIDIGILDKTIYAPIPGYALLIMGIQGIYLSGAMILNEAFDRTILPIPGPIL
jgi:succinate-acetate transporter protein